MDTSGRADRRRHVVDAFIDLVLETGAAPDPSDVAARAGVSRATFFRYFSTLYEIRNEAGIRVLERFPDVFVIPDLGCGDLDGRIGRFVDQRVRLHETLNSLERLVRVSAVHDAGSADQLDAGRQILVDEVRRHFASELGGRTPAQQDDLVGTIAVLTSFESWDHLRNGLHRSPMQIRRAWRSAVVAMLTASG